MKFEKQTRFVTYVPEDDAYRVTSDPVTAERRRAKDARRFLVGVAAAVSFWDGPERRGHCAVCANTVRMAYLAGDRYLLDTDEARRAAELVSDLSVTKPDEGDICSALVSLSNAIASVRLSDIREEAFDVLPACRASLEKCFAVPGFESWSPSARRRRFLYELRRCERTSVVCTLMGLYFGVGATPILTARQRQELLSIEKGEGLEGAVRYMDDCLRKITEYRFA